MRQTKPLPPDFGLRLIPRVFAGNRLAMEVGPFWQVLAYEFVGVLIQASLPGVVRVRKETLCLQLFGNVAMVGKLLRCAPWRASDEGRRPSAYVVSERKPNFIFTFKELSAINKMKFFS